VGTDTENSVSRFFIALSYLSVGQSFSDEGKASEQFAKAGSAETPRATAPERLAKKCSYS
jgi:hypothetical protein